METAAPPADDLALLQIDDLGVLSEYLRDRRADLNASVMDGAGGLESARAYSDLVDGVVRRMFHLACVRAGGGADPESAPIAVVATGGYGRRELCPYSDIDITFVPHRDGDPLVDRIVKEMFTLVMRVFIDANGMEVGYAYRLMEDCAALDHQTTSGLLDARLLVGSGRIFIQLEHAYWSQFNPADFIFTKLNERRRQRDRAGSTPRVVEPILKEGPGGLRDLQASVWVVQALHSLAAARVRGERAWDVLQREGGITADEARALQAAKEFLFRVRNALHVLAGAERDQLVVTRQEEVAAALGYRSEDARQSTQPETQVHGVERGLADMNARPHHVRAPSLARSAPPVERFMRDLYDHLSAVHRISQQVMRRTERARLFLGIGLDCVGQEIEPAGMLLAAEDPLWMLWACELAQRYDLGFSDSLERAIAELLESRPEPGTRSEAGDVFTRILGSPRGCYPILQRMAELGILGWILPEVGALMDLIPYDPSHDYTVGQHTLYAVCNLDALRAAEGPEETGDLRRIMAEVAHPEQLYLAALLHDAGKITDERPHSEVGEDLAAQVCARLRWDSQATDNVKFLVRHHLLMAETSRLRDLNLDETIRDFTSVVGDLDRLHMLYLLTYADTRAVGAGVWTQVKGRFLRDLERRAERFLVSEEEELDDADLTRTRRRLLKELSVENLPPAEVAEHLASMPAPYILNTSLNEMALHIGFVRRARQGEPVVDFHEERDATFTEVTVCARDDPEPGLLSKIAGVFYAADLDVHAAQVFTRVTPSGESSGERIAIDTLYADFRGRRLTPGKRRELAVSLPAVLTGSATVAELLEKRRKPVQIGGPVQSLKVRNDLSDRFTVVEVTSEDERAMLYRASGALSSLGWDIHSARLSFFRGRSVASFYVTGAKQVSDSDALRLLQELMPIAT